MTSPAPDIRMSSDEVRRHASTVDESATMIDEAVAGAVHALASTESYGVLLGPMFASPLSRVQDLAIDQIKHAAATTTTLADLLRSMATGFDVSDADAAYRLGGRW